jgi:hypothetical protein
MLQTIRAVALAITCACVVSNCSAADGVSDDPAESTLRGVWRIVEIKIFELPEGRITPNGGSTIANDSVGWSSVGRSGPQFLRITRDTFVDCGYRVDGEWSKSQWSYGVNLTNAEKVEFFYDDGVMEAEVQLDGHYLKVTTPVPPQPSYAHRYTCRRSSEAELQQAKNNRPEVTDANPTSAEPRPTDSHSAHEDHSSVEEATLTAERQIVAEAAVDSTAAKYRNEAAKPHPDSEQLSLLEATLQSQVRQALEAKMKVRELRLQLAALNLQEVQAEHERRKSMLDETVKERVRSLIALHGDSTALPETQSSVESAPRTMPPVDDEKQGRLRLASTRYIFPGEALSKDDFQLVDSSERPAPPDTIKSFDHLNGRYLRWACLRGQFLGWADTTPSQRSQETIADEVLENIANHDVFGQSKLGFIRTSPNCFDPGHSLDNWAELPAWTPIFINTANSDLINAIQEQGGSNRRHAIAILKQFDLLQLVWTSSGDWDFKATGHLLSELVESNTSSPGPVNDVMLQAIVLRQIARTTGKLPDTVHTAEPSDTATVERLKLLDRMLAANADGTWIGQEQLRLSGLLELVPAQTIRRIIQQDDAGSGSTIRQWIYALSTQATFRTGPDMLPPPIDPVLLLTILESLTGQNEVHDERISYLCESDAFYRGQLFPHHIEEILTGTLVYRVTVLQSLANMYDLAKSDKLREAIAKLAPAVLHRDDATETADELDVPADDLEQPQ